MTSPAEVVVIDAKDPEKFRRLFYDTSTPTQDILDQGDLEVVARAPIPGKSGYVCHSWYNDTDLTPQQFANQKAEEEAQA